MEDIHGESETHAEGGKARSEMHLGTGPRGASADESSLSMLGGIARGAAANALYTSTHKVREALHRVDERTRIFTLARERPLTTLGAAFGTGLLLAFVMEPREGNRHLERVRRRLKTAIISGVVAAIASTTPAISGPGGMVDELGDWLEGDDPEDDRAHDDDGYEDEPDYG